MFTPYLNDYGYGWDVLEREMGWLIQHDGGSTLGSSSEMRRYIDAGVVTILFCNQSFGQQTLMEAVRDKIETLAFGGEVALPPEVKPAVPEKIKKYEGTYKLGGEGSLVVMQQGGKLVISAQGQDAITALFDPENPNPGFYQELNRLSESVFKAAIRGDYQPFGDILHNREQRMRPVQDLIEQRLQMFQPRTGEIKEAISKGTLPSTFDGQKAAMTYVELKGEKGSVYFVLVWRDRKNVGVGPTSPPGEMAIPFMPVSDSEFAGYRIDTAVNSRVEFRMDEKGVVKALAFPGIKDIIALKEMYESPLPES
jgi:hypothetical protein